MPNTMSRLEHYHRDGFVVIEGALDAGALAEVRDALAPLLREGPSGRNSFEGEHTKRVYTLVGRGKPFEDMVLHPAVLELIDQLLLPRYLLTASQAIAIAPGETPQPIHYDDTFYTIARPRPAVSVSTMWAITDFTEDNGATEIIAQSHLWDDARVAGCYAGDNDMESPELGELKPIIMPAGSVAVFAGTLLHRGGNNRSDTVRTAISHQYCQPWARQQETFVLGVPHPRAAAMPQRLREMLGYSIHPPFMGQVTARHPQKVLEPGYVNALE